MAAVKEPRQEDLLKVTDTLVVQATEVGVVADPHAAVAVEDVAAVVVQARTPTKLISTRLK